MKRAVLTGCALSMTLVLAMLPDFARSAGSVTIGMQLEPPILDPTASPAAPISEALYGNVFEGLVRPS
jgi:peptide/nickel transport system substrate-binding protein